MESPILIHLQTIEYFEIHTVLILKNALEFCTVLFYWKNGASISLIYNFVNQLCFYILIWILMDDFIIQLLFIFNYFHTKIYFFLYFSKKQKHTKICYLDINYCQISCKLD